MTQISSNPSLIFMNIQISSFIINVFPPKRTLDTRDENGEIPHQSLCRVPERARLLKPGARFSRIHFKKISRFRISRQAAKKMRDHRTPFKENSRSTQFSNRRHRDPQAKKLQKIPKKSLSSVFASDEDGLKDSVDFSSVSEIVDSNDDSSDAAESLLPPSTPAQSTTSDIFDSSDLFGDNLNGSQVNAINLPDKMAKTRTDATSSFTLPPHERDYLDETLSIRSRVVYVFSALWVFAMFGIIFSGSGSQGSYIGPLPT